MKKLLSQIRSASPAIRLAVFTGCALVIALLLELSLFNYRFWQTRDLEPVDLIPAVWDEGIHQQADGTWYFDGDHSEFYFRDIDTHISNIHLAFEDLTVLDVPSTWLTSKIHNHQLEEMVNVTVIADDYANTAGLIMPTHAVVAGVPSTEYLTVHLTGITHKMGIQLEDVGGRTLRITAMQINVPVPMNFRVDRVLLLLTCALIVYTCRVGSAWRRIPLNLKSPRQKIAVALAFVATLLMGCWFIQGNVLLVHNAIPFSEDYGLRYNMLTDALLKGQLYVDKYVDPAILTLENPYDPEALKAVGVVWSDFAYFEGKYYVYFGIVPVLLFYLPAKVLFGYDVTPFQCMLVLLPFFIAGCYLLIYRLTGAYRRGREPLSLVSYLLLTTLFACGSFGLYAMEIPDMYYLPIYTAVTLMIWGLWFWLSALRDPEESTFRLGDCTRLSAWRLAAGSLCIAMLAGSRPQFLAAAFLALPIFWNAVFKKRLLFSAKGWWNTVCFLAPLLIFGAFIAWYNFARFGSITDFGATYNQTSNDMTSRGFSLGRFFQGLYYFVLQPTAWEEAFPFLHIAIHNTQYTGTNIFEDTYGGILFLQPATLMLFLIPRLRAGLKAHGMLWFVLIAGGFGVVIAGLDSVIAAVLARYYLDFGVFIMLAAVVVWLEMVTPAEDRSGENEVSMSTKPHMIPDVTLARIGRSLLLPLAAFALLITVMMVYQIVGYGAGNWYVNPNRFYSLKTLIEFWY